MTISRNTAILVTREGLGHVTDDDRQFGLEMLDRYLHALEGRQVKPQAICFYTDGVKLVCEGSPVILSLKLLQGMGIRIVACRTCLEHFGLLDRLAAGEIVGMNDIVGLLHEADSVVTV